MCFYFNKRVAKHVSFEDSLATLICLDRSQVIWMLITKWTGTILTISNKSHGRLNQYSMR